jgi:hypothetical protein
LILVGGPGMSPGVSARFVCGALRERLR